MWTRTDKRSMALNVTLKTWFFVIVKLKSYNLEDYWLFLKNEKENSLKSYWAQVDVSGNSHDKKAVWWTYPWCFYSMRLNIIIFANSCVHVYKQYIYTYVYINICTHISCEQSLTYLIYTNDALLNSHV